MIDKVARRQAREALLVARFARDEIADLKKRILYDEKE